jgi:chromosome partitioning protein
VQTSAGGLYQLLLGKEKRGVDLTILDTPGSFEDGVLQSINLSDLCLLVTRPNFLDIASLLTTAEAVRRLGKPALVVLNQAPSRRNGVEAPVVERAIEALRFTGLPIASVGLRARTAFQASLSRGLAAFEWEPKGPAAEEIRRLWADVEARLAAPGAQPALRA